jgi:hypothetical protein
VDLLNIVIILALVATLIALLLGLTSMGKGGAFDKSFGEGFMWLRVGLQGLAVGLLILALWLR